MKVWKTAYLSLKIEIQQILYSLDKPDPDIEQSWIAESEARYEAYKRGELDAIDWEEIKKRFSLCSFLRDRKG